MPAHPVSPLHAPVEALYAEHHGWLLSWLRKKLSNVNEAADIGQDTFLRMLSRPVAEEAIREPHRYLATIANGLLADHWRRKRIENAYLDELALRPAEHAPGPEHRLMILQTLFELDAMLDRLSEKCRHAFLWAQLDGLSHAQIAARLSVSDRMVRKYLTQAMHQCLLLDARTEA